MSAPDRIRVLIVEDEGLVGCDMADSLTKLGYEVVATCVTGEEALSRFDETRPDLVLLDVHLSGELDGIDTAHRLRQRDPVAIVYVTACADLETVARARATQPHGYLLKPFSEDELRLTVEIAANRFQEETRRHRREQSYFEAFQSLADGVIAADLAGGVTFMNPAASAITGWNAKEAAGKSLHEVFRIFEASGEPAEVQLTDTGAPSKERTVWLTSSTGERVAIQDRAAPLRDQHNHLSGVIILFRRSQAQESAGKPVSDKPKSEVLASAVQAQAPNAPLIDVVESISDPLLVLDAGWRISYANASALGLFERRHDQIYGAGFWDHVPTATKEAHYEALSHARLSRETVTREIYFEEKQLWLELRGYPFAEGLLVLIQDITTRREEAERRNRMDRLESLGLLARGFAHEFNNLLTVLLGNLSLAEMKLRSAIKMPELHTAKDATIQAQSLVQQLLTFARGGAPIKRPVEPADLIENFLLHHSWANGVRYDLEIQPDLPTLALDPAQIRRLLSNLVRNAEQAQPSGGHVIIRCFAPDPSEMFPNEMVREAPNLPQGIVVEVTDHGEGIPPDSLPHIFEPYFSTRKADNATGLGLTVCESIAKAHGGSLSVRSETGKGTTVRFYLPIDSEAEEVDATGLSKAFDTAPSGPVRILVLEDDPLVRSLIVRNLTSQGYEVAESIEGGETVKLYHDSMEQGRPYDLVILDLSIPNGMGGVRAMEKLRELDADVLAIVSSGYSDDPVMAKPATYGFAAVLPKPYEPADMLRLIKTVLSARGMKK
jgi:PAS domain S-box-containing protein